MMTASDADGSDHSSLSFIDIEETGDLTLLDNCISMAMPLAKVDSNIQPVCFFFNLFTSIFNAYKYRLS